MKRDLLRIGIAVIAVVTFGCGDSSTTTPPGIDLGPPGQADNVSPPDQPVDAPGGVLARITYQMTLTLGDSKTRSTIMAFEDEVVLVPIEVTVPDSMVFTATLADNPSCDAASIN